MLAAQPFRPLRFQISNPAPSIPDPPVDETNPPPATRQPTTTPQLTTAPQPCPLRSQISNPASSTPAPPVDQTNPTNPPARHRAPRTDPLCVSASLREPPSDSPAPPRRMRNEPNHHPQALNPKPQSLPETRFPTPRSRFITLEPRRHANETKPPRPPPSGRKLIAERRTLLLTVCIRYANLVNLIGSTVRSLTEISHKESRLPLSEDRP